jgi:2'-5' RNA ligase
VRVSAPLILTLMLDERSQAFFDRAREQWFPAKLNFIAAHITLVHHLPGAQLASIGDDLAIICARQSPVRVSVTGLRSLGRGVAYMLHTAEIEQLRSGLATQWRNDLTAQDRQGWRPHVTVQNKVSPAEARDLLARLTRAFVAFDATATGLALWHYRGGPWENEAVVPFGGSG